MMDIAARRRAFREGVIRDAVQSATALLASQRRVRIVDVVLVPLPTAATLQVGDNIYFRLGLNGIVTILAWSMAGEIANASASGTITVDILTGATLATVATICSSQKPTLTAQAERADQLPGNLWTVQIADPQWIMAKVTSTGGTLEVVSLTLRCAVG
jgi:hypothetical protein